MVRNQQWIVDMLQAAREILSFAEGFDRAALESDRRTCSAILYEIIVIGEAANRLFDEFRACHAHIFWQSIVGMQTFLPTNTIRLTPRLFGTPSALMFQS